MATLAEEILATPDREPVKVTVWGKSLWIVPISGVERDAFDVAKHKSKDAEGNVAYWRAQYLVRCLFEDQAGTRRVFTNEQAAQLAAKSGETLKELWDLATAANASGPGAVTVEAKNS